ncbi:MAG: hypothetical protein ACPGWM_03610, partial [Flavobacteriales bacterium]
SIEFVQTIHVIDDVDPVWNDLPQSEVTYSCGDQVPGAFDLTANDNCAGLIDASVHTSTNDNDPCDVVITRTYTAADGCGNSIEFVQTIHVIDDVDPVWGDLPVEQITINCNDDLPMVPVLTATDACTSTGEVMYSESTDDSDPCAVDLIRTWSVSDACGNTATFTQTITRVDDQDPVFLPYDMYVQVDCPDAPYVTIEATDNCGEVTITYEDMNMSGGCEGVLYRIYTATDACGNSTTTDQIIGLQDNQGPQIMGTGGSYSVDCNSVPEVPTVTYSDNCSSLDEIETTFEETIVPGNCPANYSIVWTWTATDFCDNVSVVSETIVVTDDEAPIPTEMPVNLIIQCDQPVPDAPELIWNDNCSFFDVDFLEESEPGICVGHTEIVRTWTATDVCGNEREVVQLITIIDTTPPVISNVPADVTINCDDLVPTDEPDLFDNCSTATLEVIDVIITTTCDSEYYIERTFKATDDCGNESSALQQITVVDVEAPMLNFYPSDAVLDCEDEVPAPYELVAEDNCDGAIDVDFTEELVGDLPDPDANRDCLLNHPLDPQTPNDWAMFMFGEGMSTYYTSLEASYVEYEVAPNQYTAVIEATLVSVDNPNAGWLVTMNLENGMKWQDWSTQVFDTGFKDDFDLAGLNYLDWLYFIISTDSHMSGWGDYEGSEIDLMHAPSEYFYGFQVGEAANNVNAENGAGGWFTYEGTFVNSAEGINHEVDGSGDFAWDLDCCPRYEVVRTWTATDCAGNVESHTQVISFEELSEPNAGIAAAARERHQHL